AEIMITPVHMAAPKVQFDMRRLRQPVDEGFLPGAVEVRPPNVSATDIAPVHLAASQIKSDMRRRIQPSNQNRLSRAVEVGPSDVSATCIGTVDGIGWRPAHFS